MHEHDADKRIGRVVKGYLIHKGLRLSTEAPAAFGLSKSSMCDLLSGRRPWTMRYLVLAAKVTGVDAARIVREAAESPE